MSDETTTDEAKKVFGPSRKEIEDARMAAFGQLAATLATVGSVKTDPHGFECGCTSKFVEDERRRCLNALDALMMPPERSFMERLLPALSPALIALVPVLEDHLTEIRRIQEEKERRAAPPPSP